MVATKECCPAVIALKSMEIEFELVIATEAYTYGETMHRYWEMGDSFINVEHDIVPYPGALQAVDVCPEPWCGYDYPIGYGGLQGPGRGSALGVVKFSRELIEANPLLSRPWRYVPWNQLDAAIFTSLKGKVPERYVNARWTDIIWHEHKPAVAHLSPYRNIELRDGC